MEPFLVAVRAANCLAKVGALEAGRGDGVLAIYVAGGRVRGIFVTWAVETSGCAAHAVRVASATRVNACTKEISLSGLLSDDVKTKTSKNIVSKINKMRGSDRFRFRRLRESSRKVLSDILFQAVAGNQVDRERLIRLHRPPIQVLDGRLHGDRPHLIGILTESSG